MEFPRPLCLFLVLLTIVTSSQAYKFYVGGSEGWVPNPSKSYNEWAGRNRFQINDTLVFQYKKGSDTLLEVNKEDYDKCNKSNPVMKFEDGDSDTEFKLERSGPFYFISGKDQNCEKGQKMIVVVLAPRGQSQTPPSPKFPSPSPSPSTSHSHPPSSGSLPAPATTPSGHPPSPSPAVSQVPAIGTPAKSPAGSPGRRVAGPPVPSTGTPPSSPAPPSNSSSETVPPPSQAWGASPSGFLVFSVTIVVGAVLLR